MKISLEWLSDYLPGPLPPEELAHALTHGGLPVEVIERHGDDTVLDVEVTSNRGDCLSHIGVARELAALLGREFREVKANPPQGRETADSPITVKIEAPDLCSLYTARIIRGVEIGPSPAWLSRRLEAVGLRAVNNVVDVTNYVLFELGQPLHAFDLARIGERRIVVRRARAGESLVSIDGHERKLTPGMLVIADAVRPLALAGVMGGRDSEVSGNTTDVLLESALFDPLSVRKTSRTLAMKSDSSYRFERGIDPTLPGRASLRAAELILQTAGGELLGGQAVAGDAGYTPKKLSLRPSALRRVLGVDLPEPQVVNALGRLRLAPVPAGDRIDVVVPSDRLDINREIDLVEEVARLVGYEQIPVRDEIAIRLSPPDPDSHALVTVRSVLHGAGYDEAVTFSFVSDALAADFLPPADIHAAAPLMRADVSVRKADASLRPSLIPGLLEALRRNESFGTADAKLYEIGATFWNDAAGQSQERRKLALVGSGDLAEVRGVIESALRKLNIDLKLQVIPDTHPGFARAGGGRVEWNGRPIGFIGRIDKAVGAKLSLREAPVAAELEIEPLIAGAQRVPQLRPLPAFPPVRRDLSLIVPRATPYALIESLVREEKPALLEDLEFVTTYRGKPLEAGQKSVTITLVFRSPTHTLTSEQVDASVKSLVAAARTRLGATLRE